MTEIMSAKRDDKKEYFEKLHTVVEYADVLVWDDQVRANIQNLVKKCITKSLMSDISVKHPSF